jgi:hypothetical protein
MSIRNIGIGMVVAAVLLSSCKEEADPAYVWGSLEYTADSLMDDYKVNGTLAKGGENYYGWCRQDEDGFSFAVGDGAPGQMSSTGSYYEVSGISGSPESGVYDSDGDVKIDDSYHKSIKSIRIINVHNWKLDSGDIPDNTCYVSLFAEAAEEEVTPDDYGSLPFQFFVQIQCNGLDVESDKGDILRDVYMDVWFDNCDV